MSTTHANPRMSRPEPRPFTDDMLADFAAAIDWSDWQTTGSIRLVTGPNLGGMRRPQYVIINDGECEYAVDACDVSGWERPEGCETTRAYTEFCQSVDIVTAEELEALVDDMEQALGGINSDAFVACYPTCSDCGQRHDERDGCDEKTAWEQEHGYTEFAVINDDGDEALAERMEAWLDENAPEFLTFTVRLCRSGEADSTYGVNADGSLQVLGYSIPVPGEVSDLVNRAFVAACEAK